MRYWEPETVKVEYDDDGVKSFFFYGREGREDLGPELMMAADTYNAGTLIEVREAVIDEKDTE